MLPKLDVLSTEQVEAIHEHSMKILEEVGLDFLYEPALEVFKANGQRVEGDRVYFDREFIEEQIKKAPSQFTLHARNPENDLVCGGDNIIFMPGYGVSFIYEADGNRRDSVMEDYDNFVKLAGASENLHMTGGNIADPSDVPDEIRHLKMLYSSIKNSDKCFMGSASNRERAEDVIEMASILFGGREAIKEKPSIICLINSITPLKFDDYMAGSLMAYAEAGQPVVIAALVMAGSTGPASIAGSLSLQNAEVLAGIALAQCVNPGTPVVYASSSAITDMKTGALSIGNPECALFTASCAQMGRHYGIPTRSGGGLTDSKVVDAQAGYESMMTLLNAGVTGINYVLHTAGILEGYMAMSYEKFVVDDEIAGMVLRYLKGIDFSEDAFAFDVIKKVGPGEHFLAQKHTRKYYPVELRDAELSDRLPYNNWAKEGLDTLQRANKQWQDVLATYEAPELDPAVDEALQKFMEKRIAELTK
jgi:glycine betaine---corrinoid protein Co-methyltransferase